MLLDSFSAFTKMNELLEVLEFMPNFLDFINDFLLL
jgi:hypothetical protein